jgi:cyclic dehypoxanthinyl futalosine synthase
MPAPIRPELDILDPHVLTDIVSGELRLAPQQALRLYREMPIHELGRWADARCRLVHGDHIRTYVIDRNINYTNVCTARCTFCAFRRDGDDEDSYTLETDVLLQKIEELSAIGGTQILMQGGMNPELPLEWYLDLLRAIKDRFPHIHVHAFSPPEFVEFVRFFQPPGDTFRAKLHWVMAKLKNAGLDSVPGGGGEIFAPVVRRKIGLGKCDAAQWLTVMHVAHELGMNTSATMMFGHIEGVADRIHHMEQVRRWQDRSIVDFAADGGGRYKAFIAWPFQRENTPLGRCKEWGTGDGDDLRQVFAGDSVANEFIEDWTSASLEEFDAVNQSPSYEPSKSPDVPPLFGRRVRMAGASDYLRTQALSRLYLDNIYSIGSSWVTMGPHIGQTALHFGASDMGSVMMEENVVSAAGTTYCLNEPMLCRLIRDAGFVPAQRNNEYNLLKVHDDADSPDLCVADWSNLRAQRLHVQTQAEVPSIPLTISTAERR